MDPEDRIYGENIPGDWEKNLYQKYTIYLMECFEYSSWTIVKQPGYFIINHQKYDIDSRAQ